MELKGLYSSCDRSHQRHRVKSLLGFISKCMSGHVWDRSKSIDITTYIDRQDLISNNPMWLHIWQSGMRTMARIIRELYFVVWKRGAAMADMVYESLKNCVSKSSLADDTSSFVCCMAWHIIIFWELCQSHWELKKAQNSSKCFIHMITVFPNCTCSSIFKLGFKKFMIQSLEYFLRSLPLPSLFPSN